MEQVRWEDPPPRHRSAAGVWFERLEPLLAQPKRWAIVYTAKNTGAISKMQHILHRRGVKMPPGQWVLAVRTVDGEHRLYARYLGPDQDGAR